MYGVGVGAAAAMLSAIVLADVPAATTVSPPASRRRSRGLGGSLGVGAARPRVHDLVGGDERRARRPAGADGVRRCAAQGQDELVARAGDALANGIAAAALVAAAFLIIGALVLRIQPRSDAAGTYEAAPVAA